VTLNALAPTAPTRRLGHGSLGARRSALPRATHDVCFAGDLVCDLGSSLPVQLYQALIGVIHTQYGKCCGGTPLLLTRLEGRWAARELRR
jgi:hypothetical protein